MKTEFVLIKTADSDDLFCKLSELLLDLENIIGSPELMEKQIEELLLLASEINPLYSEKYKIFLDYFRDVKQLLRADEKNFYDYKYELRSNNDGRFIIDNQEGVKYFDHPYHQNYFKKNNTAEKCITVTK